MLFKKHKQNLTPSKRSEDHRFRTAYFIEFIIGTILTNLKESTTLASADYTSKNRSLIIVKLSKEAIQKDLLLSDFDDQVTNNNPAESGFALALSTFYNSSHLDKKQTYHQSDVKKELNPKISPPITRSRKNKQPSPGEHSLKSRYAYENNPKDLHLCLNASLICELMPYRLLQTYVSSAISYYKRKLLPGDLKRVNPSKYP